MKQQTAHPNEIKNQPFASKQEPLSHSQIFVANYPRLLSWAEYLCSNKVLAQDLVQNAYIQFVTKKPLLDDIDNIFSYLCRLVSNLHKNQMVRTAAQKRGGGLEAVSLPVIEELLVIDTKNNQEARELLVEIAHFVVGNRLQSKTSDVLILRFLLGYYPKEIAQIFMSSIYAINNLIMRGRQELREFLKQGNIK